VRIQPVTDDIAESLGLDIVRGALIAGIVKDGPVDNGSIKTGDVIIRFDGKDIREMRDLPLAVAESPVGKEIDVVLFRDGKEQTVKVVLGRQAAASADDSDEASPPSGSATGDTETKPEKDSSANRGDILGMGLADLDDTSRTLYSIDSKVNGVVITSVKPGSSASEKNLKAGDVIVEVDQETADSVSGVLGKLTKLTSQGRRTALLVVSDSKGDLRIISISLE
jgi:serine protease Do